MKPVKRVIPAGTAGKVIALGEALLGQVRRAAAIVGIQAMTRMIQVDGTNVVAKVTEFYEMILVLGGRTNYFAQFYGRRAVRAANTTGYLEALNILAGASAIADPDDVITAVRLAPLGVELSMADSAVVVAAPMDVLRGAAYDYNTAIGSTVSDILSANHFVYVFSDGSAVEYSFGASYCAVVAGAPTLFSTVEYSVGPANYTLVISSSLSAPTLFSNSSLPITTDISGSERVVVVIGASQFSFSVLPDPSSIDGGRYIPAGTAGHSINARASSNIFIPPGVGGSITSLHLLILTFPSAVDRTETVDIVLSGYFLSSVEVERYGPSSYPITTTAPSTSSTTGGFFAPDPAESYKVSGSTNTTTTSGSTTSAYTSDERSGPVLRGWRDYPAASVAFTSSRALSGSYTNGFARYIDSVSSSQDIRLGTSQPSFNMTYITPLGELRTEVFPSVSVIGSGVSDYNSTQTAGFPDSFYASVGGSGRTDTLPGMTTTILTLDERGAALIPVRTLSRPDAAYSFTDSYVEAPGGCPTTHSSSSTGSASVVTTTTSPHGTPDAVPFFPTYGVSCILDESGQIAYVLYSGAVIYAAPGLPSEPDAPSVTTQVVAVPAYSSVSRTDSSSHLGTFAGGFITCQNSSGPSSSAGSSSGSYEAGLTGAASNGFDGNFNFTVYGLGSLAYIVWFREGFFGLCLLSLGSRASSTAGLFKFVSSAIQFQAALVALRNRISVSADGQFFVSAVADAIAVVGALITSGEEDPVTCKALATALDALQRTVILNNFASPRLIRAVPYGGQWIIAERA